MRITVSGKMYEFDSERFLNAEYIAVERATGLTPVEWEQGLNRGSAIALTALVWILQKRHDNPILAFDDVVFEMSSLDMVEGDGEGKAPPSSASPDVKPDASTLENTSSPSSENTGSDRGNLPDLSMAT